MMPSNTTEKRATNTIKILVVIVGIISTVLVYSSRYFDTIYLYVESIGTMSGGPLLAMFTLGMLVPSANSTGTFFGTISGLAFMGCLVIAEHIHNAQGAMQTPRFQTSVEGCNFTLNLKTTISDTNDYIDPWIFRISPYYGIISFIWTMLIGTIVSISTGGRHQKINKELLSPVVHFLLPKKSREEHSIVYEAQDEIVLL